MALFLMHHRHQARECAAVYASFRAIDSPLRGRTATSSCATGGHEIWWLVDAADERSALVQLPGFVAERTVALAVRDVRIP